MMYCSYSSTFNNIFTQQQQQCIFEQSSLLGNGSPMETDRPQWHTKINSSWEECQGLTGWGRHIKVNTIFTMSVTPWSKLFSILGVERQTIDIVRRGSSGYSNNIISLQINRFSLDLIFQNCMNSAMKNWILTRVKHLHSPYKTLVDHFNSFWETIKMTIFKISSLVSVSKWTRLRSTRLINWRSNTVGLWSTTQRLWFVRFWSCLLFCSRCGFGASLNLTLLIIIKMSKYLESSIIVVVFLLKWSRSGIVCFW